MKTNINNENNINVEWVKITKNILSVIKINKNGSYAVIIPAQFARDLGITEESSMTCNKVGQSLHYNKVLIE